jgi:hypothetical protein
MKKIIISIFLVIITIVTFAQKPKDGKYFYNFKDAHYQDNPITGTCTVVIKGSNIIVYYKSGNPTGKKGTVYKKGLLLKHKSGVWIIAKTKDDVNAEDVGGCSDGPIEINIKEKFIWWC